MECNCWNPEPHRVCDHDLDCTAYRTGDVNLELCWNCYGCGAAEFLLKWQPTKDDLVHELEDDRLEGIIDNWFNDKGYGWVKFSTGQRVFTHKNDTVGKIHLQPGTLVKASIVKDADGRYRADRVEVLY